MNLLPYKYRWARALFCKISSIIYHISPVVERIVAYIEKEASNELVSVTCVRF